MTPSIDQTLHQFANLLPNSTLLPILTLLPNFGGFHRTLQRVRLANKGRSLLRTPGPLPFGTCICSNVETIISWSCHVYGPFEFRTSLGTSILLCTQTKRNSYRLCSQLERNNWHLSSTSHTDTSMTYCQSITNILIIIWVRCILPSLRSKTRRRATPLFPTRIYSCQSIVTVSYALPFTTNVTISTSISQTFRSWIAIFTVK